MSRPISRETPAEKGSLMTDKRKIKLTVMITAVFQMGNLGISPSLSSIAREYPGYGDAAAQLLMTFPDIFVIIITLLTGYLSSRVQRRWLAAAGVGCYALAGICGGLFSRSFPVLFVWAAMLGIGMGLFTPTMANVITSTFDGDERGEVLGMQSCMVNAGGILLTVTGGLLSSISWRANYFVYLLSIPALICIMAFLPGNELPPRAERGRGRVRLPALMAVCGALGLLFMLVNNVYPTNTAMLLAERGEEHPEVLAGFVNGTVMAGGIVSALIFPRFVKRLGPALFAMAFAVVAAGLFIGLIQIRAALFVGAFLSGFGISFAMPTGVMVISRKLAPELVPLCSSLFLAIFFLGGFLSAIVITPLAAVFGGGVFVRFVAGGVLSAVLAVCAAVSARWMERLPEAQ